jgi:hypothetical protein
MASDQELQAAKDRISQLERNESERTKAAAIAGELGKYELTTGSLDQLSQLIGPSVVVTKLNDGRDLILGPDYRPLDAHVAAIMAQPAYAHYHRAKSPAAPGQHAPQGQQPASAGASAVREILPGENLGLAVARVAQATQAQPFDSRLDPSKPFAIGPKSRPKT